jgi:hypothetical protein
MTQDDNRHIFQRLLQGTTERNSKTGYVFGIIRFHARGLRFILEDVRLKVVLHSGGRLPEVNEEIVPDLRVFNDAMNQNQWNLTGEVSAANL